MGGDYFDVRQIAPDVWFTVVADVSGKGVSSALLASLLQGAFLLASSNASQVEQTMARVNRYLNERARGEKYATVFYCTVSSSGLLQWSNAGHCAPIVLTQAGRLRTLQTTGMPLGMIESAEYRVESTQLEAGDKIVIYSDGLTEAENAENQFFGADRLRSLLKSRCADGCEQLHAAIHQAVEGYLDGAVPSDDVTLVVLEYRPESTQAQ